jgi:outer membrane biosynthesis protein TonB
MANPNTDPNDPRNSNEDRDHERTDGGTQTDQPAERMIIDDDFEQRMDDQPAPQPDPQPTQSQSQQPSGEPQSQSQDAMQPREAQPVDQGQQQPQQPAQGQQDARPPQANQQRQQASQPPQQSPQQSSQQPTQQSAQDNVQLDPWEIHQNVVNSMDKSETAFIDTKWGELRYTVHMPDKGIYQAAVGSLPDDLLDWMGEIADEYGNDADLDELIRSGEVDPPRIVYGEKVMDTFDRLLRECLEHAPKSGDPNDKLTQTPTNDIIRGLDPNEHTVPLGFQCIRLGAERSGIRNFRME